jgi:hypothetical protein
MKHPPARRLFSLVAFALLAVAAVAGCAGKGGAIVMPTGEEIRQRVDDAVALKTSTTAELHKLQAVAATQAATDPAAAATAKALADVNAKLDQLDKFIPAAQALARTAATGQVDPGLSQALQAFGFYGSLIGGGLSLVLNAVQRSKNAALVSDYNATDAALRQTVIAIDAAGGATPTQKAALRASLDEAGRALVSQYRLPAAAAIAAAAGGDEDAATAARPTSSGPPCRSWPESKTCSSRSPSASKPR